MVPREGLEPTHLQEVADFKSAASAFSPPRHSSNDTAQRFVFPKRCADRLTAYWLAGRFQVVGFEELDWRRRADSNRRIEVLQTSALTTWLRRLMLIATPVVFMVAIYSRFTKLGFGAEGGT